MDIIKEIQMTDLNETSFRSVSFKKPDINFTSKWKISFCDLPGEVLMMLEEMTVAKDDLDSANIP